MGKFEDSLQGIDVPINAAYGRWGKFSDDAARVITYVSQLEKVAPELIAVTWMNESVFRFYPDPNTNKSPNDFIRWDVGPMQMNVHWTLADLRVQYYTLPAGMVVEDAIGSKHPFFNGNPTANIRLAARKLLKLSKVSDEERAVKYTGPAARPYRLKSYQTFAPLFKGFFARYTK